MANAPFIEVRDVSFSYNEAEENRVDVLKHISLSIEKGTYAAILGHNGSGKSTLAKLMNLILTPTEGKILIDGREITGDDFSEDDLFDIRRRIGMVFQNPDNQLVATVVEEDIAFGAENLGIEPALIRKRVDDALAEVGMTEYAKHSPTQLSGGQKQRIAIAGILAMRPECIIFDESTAMLDPIGRDDVIGTMEKLNREGITVLNITHNMEEAARAERVIVIDGGKVFLDGTPRQVFSRVKELKSVGLDVPQVTELLDDLRKCGWKLPAGVLDDEEGAELLASLLR